MTTVLTNASFALFIAASLTGIPLFTFAALIVSVAAMTSAIRDVKRD